MALQSYSSFIIYSYPDMKHLTLCILAWSCMLLLAAGSAHAQTRLAGTVTDANTNTALDGVSIEIENTIFGTVTDNSGHFSIYTSMSFPVVLMCRRPGYTNQKYTIDKLPNGEIKIEMRHLGADKPQELSAPEYQTKLAFIERFAQLATFPASARANAPTFNIGIWGANPFGEDLFVLKTHNVKGRNIEVVFTDSIGANAAIDVLFIPSSRTQDTRMAAVSQWAQDNHVLLIADEKAALEKGAMMAFTRKGDNIRFYVNKPQIDAAKIVLAKPLLDMAEQ